MCLHCSRFFKGRGLATHHRSCAAKNSPVQPPPLLGIDDSDADADADDDLPSLADIFTAHRPTLHFIPKDGRHDFGRVLAAELAQVAFKNDLASWTRLLMLPKCVLSVPKRAGKRNRGDNHSVKQLCAAWEQGQLKWLWTRNSRPAPGPRSPDSDSKRVLASAIVHARQGRLGKACATLSSSGLAPNDESTAQKLLQKHPYADPPVLIDTSNSEPLKLGADFRLLGALTSFSKDVGTDGTNFRIQHLIDANEASLPTPLMTRLRDVINLLLSGKAAIDTQRYLAGARLTALSKPGGDIRPIAAGNIFRRLASKCVCLLLQPRIRAVLGPFQVGVACRRGAEEIVHETRDRISRQWESADFTVLKIDFRNAFNCVSRQVLIDECQRHFPGLVPWVQWCYGSESSLFYASDLQSSVGVQQGDPFGPAVLSCSPCCCAQD